ncbi:hypothetical protein SUGI_0226020 [Cryptomeria japonica]|uniref:histone H1 n=1 Tax=Cryptomeria japonica TaxID=3369 RepID=UPI0024089833|nr:histone H1 [Cryptomeria japonica]GLJ14100.1 hypothetical protein SUGI_0226020 [Cryptomeria japonica]
MEQAKMLKPSATHPSYRQMITEAICGLKESNGSSQKAISRFIHMKYGAHLQTNFKQILLKHLKKLSEAGELTRIKNSFKFNRKPYNKSQRINVAKTSEAAKNKSPKKTAAAKNNAHKH